MAELKTRARKPVDVPSRIEAGKFYSPAQWAAVVGRDRRTQSVDRSTGKIPYLKIGRSVRYRGEDLLAFLKKALVTSGNGGSE